MYIVKSLVPIARKSQFFANDSEIKAAAGVSIRTPIFINFLEYSIFFEDNSFATSLINCLTSNISKH